MTGRDIFDFYRQLLATIVCIYLVVRTIGFVVAWREGLRSADRAEVVLRRYLVVQLLRARLHRFLPDLLEAAALIGILFYVIWLHV